MNFDIERMKKALEGPFITLPRGLRGEELLAYLRDQLAIREAAKEKE